MQARRGTALLLCCVLSLLLLTPIHAAAHPHHTTHSVALLAPTGVEPPHSWRSAPDAAVHTHAVRTVPTSDRSGAVHTAVPLSSHDTRTAQVRGPPGSGLA